MLMMKSNGEVEEVADRELSLEEMQKFVGGYIEVAYIPGDEKNILVVNEEGLCTNLPYNQKASNIARRTIVGDAIYMATTLMK